VHGCDAVTSSTAIPRSNIELVEAEKSGLVVLNRAGMLASICAMRPAIAVAGTQWENHNDFFARADLC